MPLRREKSLGRRRLQSAVGASLTVTGSGFVAGDAVQLLFNGALIDTSTADTNGGVMFTLVVPRVTPGSYLVVLSGRMGGLASAPLNVTPGATPAPPIVATPTAVATQQPQAAPSIPHDARYFSQTGFRIDNDDEISKISFTLR